MTGDEAFEAIRIHPALPSPHGVALEIMRLARSPGCSLVDIAKLVESDPAIAGRVLRVVNSSAFARPRAIASVTEAVAYLGTRMVQCIALSFSLVSSERRCRSFDYAGFWSNCLARAIGGGRIAQEIGAYVPDEVFTIGLLSQIGRLALAAVFPDRYHTLLTSICCNELELIEAERELFDIDHNELTARLIQQWHLPESASDAVRLQYAARERGFEVAGEPNRLACVLAVSAAVADHILKNDTDSLRLTELVQDAGRLGLSPGAVLELIQFIMPQWREMLNLLDIRELSGAQMDAIYAEATALKQRLESQETN